MSHSMQEVEKTVLLGAHLKWFTENLSDAFKMHPAEPMVLGGTVAIWRELSSSCSVESFMKWFYASMFSHITHQALPPFPGEAASVVRKVGVEEPLERAALRQCLGVSTLYRFLRAFLHARRRVLAPNSHATRRLRREAMSAASTIANMKKGSPVPSVEAVSLTKQKYKKAVANATTVPVRSFGDTDHPNTGDDDDILNAIRDVVREVFPDGGPKFRGKTSMPSISGHFDSARGKSGAAAVIKQWLSVRIGNFLNAMLYHPRSGVIEQRGEAFHPLHRVIADKLLTAPSFDCKPTFLLEPLKVRTVTAGPSLEYYACMSAQDFMWKRLSRHPTFTLIGRPVTDEVLNEFLVSRARHHLEKDGGAKWLSGDYTAATDNLRQALSRAAWNEICFQAGFPLWLRRLGSKALVGHRVHFRAERRGVPDTVVQQWNGQLMGSPLSFPILCVVNAALCSLAFRRGDWSESQTRLADMPLLVNGDDCVMHFNEKQKTLWERFSAHAGLSPSIGKCYYSSQFLQINSTNFVWEGHREGGQFKAVPYWNFSLCSSVKSKGGEPRHWSDLGSSAREFIKGFPDEEKERMMTVFIRRQQESGLLNKIPPGMSWFLPECLGGLGLPFHSSLPLKVGAPPQNQPKEFTYVSRRQLQLATYMRGKIEAGEAPMRRMRNLQIPGWVKKGMAMASKYEVRLKDVPEDRKEMMDEWGLKMSLGNFGPFLWKALARAQPDDFKVEEAEELTTFKGWYELWEKSKECNFTRPLEELMTYVPPQYGIPGGLTEVLARAEPAIPFGIINGITNRIEEVEYIRDVSLFRRQLEKRGILERGPCIFTSPRGDYVHYGNSGIPDLGITSRDVIHNLPAADRAPDQSTVGYTGFTRSGGLAPLQEVRRLENPHGYPWRVSESSGSLTKTRGCTCEVCIG